MKIHNYKEGEELSDIAKQYGISEETLRSANIDGADFATGGEEFLVLTPTRTYVLKEGDTPERIALRFGIKPVDILAQNPWISTDGIIPGKTVNLKYDYKMYGTAPTNGYLFQGFDKERLKRALPYLTYVTIASAVSDDNGIYQSFDDSEILSLIKSERKIPLLRIYDKCRYRDFKNNNLRQEYIDNIVKFAVLREYSGVVISGREKAEGFCEFLCELRRAMIGCDLILITEIDENTSADVSELSDGSIFFYPKYAFEEQKSFLLGERECYAKHACLSVGAKTFIDISALAKYSSGFITIEEAISLARKHKKAIQKDQETLICSFEDKNLGRCSFLSLEGVKETYKIIDELGFMGASFDISRTPISHFLMYNALFKSATHTTERAPEGCSRGG